MAFMLFLALHELHGPRSPTVTSKVFMIVLTFLYVPNTIIMLKSRHFALQARFLKPCQLCFEV
jgi:hypothetical protein